jgi:hypothetical protein
MLRSVCSLWRGASQLPPSAAAAAGEALALQRSYSSAVVDGTIGGFASMEMPPFLDPAFHHQQLPGAAQPAEGPQLCSVPKRRVSRW